MTAIRRYLLCVALAIGAAVCARAPIVHAQDASTVRVQLRDSVTGRPVVESVIELRGEKENRSDRSDEEGGATFTELKSGSYVISSVRIDYRPRSHILVLGKTDTVVVVTMSPVPSSLARLRVTPNSQEIFGIIGGIPSLLPVVGAKVERAGAHQETTTDSAGRYIFSDLKPGQYALRISAPGYTERLAAVDLAKGAAFESSHLLDRGKGRASGMPGAWKDFDKRLEFRGNNSAIVTVEELQRRGGGLSEALNFTKDLTAKGLRIAGRACLFINGIPKPDWPLDGIRRQEAKFIEVYGPNGDVTASLEHRWPRGKPCSINKSTLLQSRAATLGNVVTWVVV